MIITNGKISLTFDSCGICEISDPISGKRYPIESSGLKIVTDKGTVEGTLVLIRCDGDCAVFRLEKDGFTVTVVYSLCEGIGFFEKHITVEYDGEFFVKDAICEETCFAESFRNVFLHDDKTLWHCPENYFLEGEDGGLAMGLAYPYWKSDASADSVSLGYEPNFTARDSFTLETVFCGVYRNEGISRYTHGPYPGAKPMPYRTDFSSGGLNQHFKGFLIPEDAGIEPETVDFGAVWAMQDYMKYRLPKEPLPEEGFFVWQNGWWAGLANPDIAAVEVLLDSGVCDIMTQQTVFGHDNHPNTEPKYTRDATDNPIMFPVYEGEEDVDTPLCAPSALHSETGEIKDESVIGYTEEFLPPKRFAEFFRKAREMGMHIGSFNTSNNAYRIGERWLSVDGDGNAHRYLGTRVSCPGCDEFMDYHFRITCKTIDFGDRRFWAFDGRWQDFNELGGYHSCVIEDDRCMSDSHGHLPGDNRYKEVTNIRKFVKGLRERYPTMCLEQYYGLKRGSVWLLRGFNSDENYYEAGGPDDNRFQCWHNENSRFRPHYMNFTNLIGTDPDSFRYAVISAISSSSYAQVANGFNALRDYPECREFLKTWRAWASENISYLTNRRCLFGCYGMSPIDGSAHIIGDGGYIFVFNTVDFPVWGKVIANRWIGLEEDSSARYRINRIYPREEEIGVVCHGGEFYLPTEGKTANIFRIERTDAAATEFTADDGMTVVDGFERY